MVAISEEEAQLIRRSNEYSAAEAARYPSYRLAHFPAFRPSLLSSISLALDSSVLARMFEILRQIGIHNQEPANFLH